MSDVVEDIQIMDEDDYGDEEHVVEDRPGDMSTTDTFMGATPVVVDEIQDLGVVSDAEDGQDVYEVRVIEDVGPVYYGSTEIKLEKGRRYQVPAHIYRYLKDRDMLWEQR